MVVKGDKVLILIPGLDRGRGDPTDLIGVIRDMKDGKFEIGTKHGVVDYLFKRNVFDVTEYHSLKIEDIAEDVTTSVENLVRL